MICASCAVEEVKITDAKKDGVGETIYRCPRCGTLDDAAGMPLSETFLDKLADVHCYEDSPETCVFCAARALLK